MTNNIRIVLTPLLITSFLCGLRTIEFPTYHLRPWFSFIYMLLLWSVYYFLFSYTIVSYIPYNSMYYICLCLDFFVVLVSIAFGMYHDKKFKNCLKKLTIMDDTLKKLGTTTDYHKLHMKTVRLVLGWSVIVMLLTFLEVIWMKKEYNYNNAKAIYMSVMINYCSHINFINNLIFITLLEYVGLKFDQVNQYLLDLAKDNKGGVKRAWENPVSLLQKRKFPKIRNSEWMIWIIIQLHLELRKICREIDSIFGIGITMSTGCYCCWLAHELRETFHMTLFDDYMNENKIQFLLIHLSWFFIFFFKLLLINFICESISVKVNTTGNLINRISYSICDVEIRENILQFLLQVAQAPVRFYGIGLFQFGYKFLYGFFKYIATVLVILAQDYTNK
ncbi:hypothetical protein ACS0PU_011397 [Formica fusca]